MLHFSGYRKDQGCGLGKEVELTAVLSGASILADGHVQTQVKNVETNYLGENLERNANIRWVF
jgi:hypothetical protein